LEYFNDILCISGSELIRSDKNPQGFISKPLYDKMVLKGMKVVRRGTYSQPALVAFDSIPSKYQDLIKQSPVYLREKGNDFSSLIKTDPAAYEYFVTFKSPLGNMLPADVQKEYNANVAVLNAIKESFH
jgi:hypothetical protein